MRGLAPRSSRPLAHPGKRWGMAHGSRVFAIRLRGGDPLALRSRRDIPDFATAADKVVGIQARAWKDEGKSRRQ